MFNTAEIKKDFPMLQGITMNGNPLVYLDNGATTFKPQPVIDAVNYFYNNINSNIHRGDYEIAFKADQAYDHCRKTVAEFINCDEREVVFTYGATSALNTVAYGYARKNLKEGDVILLTRAEHASNALPWFRVAEETGAKIEYIELTPTGKMTLWNLRKAIHEGVRIVAIAAVTNVLGVKTPVREICRMAHKVGAVVMVDGAQSVPHTRTDVKDMDCDFLAFSGHKMCGPGGTGIMYGKYELLEKMDPMLLGGGANARFDSKQNVILKEAPIMFEAGTPNIEGVLGLDAAIQYLMKLGMDNIESHEQELRDYLFAELAKLDNVTVYNPDGDSAIAAINVKGVFSQDAACYLASQGVAVRSGNHCAKMLVDVIGTNDTIRCSMYFYNDKADVDALIRALRTCTLENCVGVFF